LPQRRAADRLLGDVRPRRFRNHHDHPRRRIPSQDIERLPRGQRADLGMQVPSAGADRLGDATAESVYGRGHCLQPGTGGGDEADRTAPHDVGETETDAADDGGAAIRSYPNQAVFPALALAITMFAFNFLGDGLRDALDPRLRGTQ
jgi:hypothetical protein